MLRSLTQPSKLHNTDLLNIKNKRERERERERGPSTMLALVQLPCVECPKIDNIIFSNVMNTVSEPVSICPMERNILVPAYFGVPF